MMYHNYKMFNRKNIIIEMIIKHFIIMLLKSIYLLIMVILYFIKIKHIICYINYL